MGGALPIISITTTCSVPSRKGRGLVERAKIPVMGFKIPCRRRHRTSTDLWALQNGADFICVGMFDFQVVNNVNTAIDVLANLQRSQARVVWLTWAELE